MKLFRIPLGNIYFLIFILLLNTFYLSKIENNHTLSHSLNLTEKTNQNYLDFSKTPKESLNSNLIKISNQSTNTNIITNSTTTNNPKSTQFTHKNYKYSKNKFNRQKKDRLRNFFFGDVSSIKRSLTFQIFRSTECSVSITDTVTYKRTSSNINFVEHLLLHNNAEEIQVKSVTSEEIKIIDYQFNPKLTIFIVHFLIDEKTEIFSIAFTYDAINLIKTIGKPNIETDKDINFSQENNNTTIIAKDPSYVYNSLVWKIYNKNFNAEEIEIKLIFDLGRDFARYFIQSRNEVMLFKKEVQELKDKTIVEYFWNGELDYYSVMVMDIMFPLYFDNCKYENLNVFGVLIGSVLITVMTLMIYFVFGSIIQGEY